MSAFLVSADEVDRPASSGCTKIRRPSPGNLLVNALAYPFTGLQCSALQYPALENTAFQGEVTP